MMMNTRLLHSSLEIKNEHVQSIFIVQIFDDDQETFLPVIYAFLPSNQLDSFAKLFAEIFPVETPKYILT